MAKELPFFRTLNLKALFGWKSRSKASEAPIAPMASGRLRCILPVTAYRNGSHQAFSLLCGRLTSSGMMFRTTTPIKEEECLELEFLLQGIGPMKLMGQVKVLASTSEVQTEAPPSQAILGTVPPIKCYSGQLELWATPTQQSQIISYLNRQNQQARVSTAT